MYIKEFIKNAIIEDLGRGDLFEKTLDINLANKIVEANIIAKEQGVFSGEKYIRVLLDMFNIKSKILEDSACFKKGDILVNLSGAYIDLLKIERVGLNLLQHSSGIATNTHSYIKILEENNLSTMLLDTRKTRANLRMFEKYSVLNGGGNNHRFGLDDCLMLKDTNLAHIKDIDLYIKNARKKIPFTSKIEIECGNISEAKKAMESLVDIIMCDNMKPDDIKKVVDFRDKYFKGILIEASGNITKDNLLDYAKTNVDAISSGALIYNASWIDMNMKMI
ncbi:carboxylating nicotinate-nucleotide diphosphorylase [Helicobacter sp. MIT 14-3879]|uniref:carboxylating nicotinate-nucleotide diphosphorylase n=1 Tax=Helicobacter sp. MIT 14-3879 TaxID=2040649 RepID=UPI000E1FB4FF|nr:carboxylating nicotinate-nucleotide diphosphorylase [Helicobacter sp. MIT 14-3879]RDU63557.1 carboxylating nicotinate-nucleotide diphosphorylase [Helicobacter sp. MIT 14-3879]